MISTRHLASIELGLDVWTANLLISDTTRADVIARLLFSTPEKLRARLGYGEYSAIITAQHIGAALPLATILNPEAFPPRITGNFLSSRPCKVTVSGARDRQPRQRGASLRYAPSGDRPGPSR